MNRWNLTREKKKERKSLVPPPPTVHSFHMICVRQIRQITPTKSTIEKMNRRTLAFSEPPAAAAAAPELERHSNMPFLECDSLQLSFGSKKKVGRTTRAVVWKRLADH